jgi:fatty acid synthase
MLKDTVRELKLVSSDSHFDFLVIFSKKFTSGDPEECNTLDTVFCKNRKTPLLIGAVKSNMGHPEPASIICSIIKSLLIFENKKIPPNLHFSEPRSDCPALVEERLKVINEVTDFDGRYIACNSFGFGGKKFLWPYFYILINIFHYLTGGNSHVLLKAITSDKVNNGIPSDDLPRLVTWSGRTEEAIDSIMNAITDRPLDVEFIGLLQNSQTETVSGNTYRGYGIFTKNGYGNATCINRNIQNFSSAKRQIVWVYSGMGSQFSTMGKDLIKFPIFANAIEKCHAVLEPKGINLKEIITSSDPKKIDNILHSFVGITAIQIGLTDILKEVGMEPDFIVGHSVGELGCSYGDGCTTVEETILSSYSRGITSVETKTIFGSMAAVGVGYSKLKDLLPEDIVIACHNSSSSCTISGPAESVSKYIEKLKNENYFAKEVAVSNIPYHSRYIADMGPKLLEKLNTIIKHPKKRSSKWISSSVPESEWSHVDSKYSTAEYHTKNLLNPVLFEEACTHLPKDALIIEIAPYGLLQSILKRTFPEGQYFSLTQNDGSDNSIHLLNSLGK